MLKIKVKIRLSNGAYRQRQYDVPSIYDDFGALNINEYTWLIEQMTSEDFPKSRVIWWSFKSETLYGRAAK